MENVCKYKTKYSKTALLIQAVATGNIAAIEDVP